MEHTEICHRTQGMELGGSLLEVSIRQTLSGKTAVIIPRFWPVPSVAFVGGIFLLFCPSLWGSPVLFWPAPEQWTWTAAVTKCWPVSCRKGSFQRTTVFTAEGPAVPPALCATAASSRCWPTDLRSPTGPCGALPAMRMACNLARFAVNSLWLCMSAFYLILPKVISNKRSPSFFSLSQQGSHSGCDHFHHWQNSITWWHFMRLVTSPCGSKWQKRLQIRVGFETGSKIILPGPCACISLDLAQFSPCASEPINVHFRQQFEVIFWLGVILQTYAVRKEWERQVPDELNSCCL